MPSDAIAKVMPSKRDKFLANLVAGHFETIKDAARAAGYSESSVTGTIYKVASSKQFQTDLVQKTSKKWDIARRLRKLTGEALLERLEREGAEADPALLLATHREMDKAVREQGLEDDSVSPQRRRWYMLKRYRLAYRMLKLGMSLSPRAATVLSMLRQKLDIPEPVMVNADAGLEQDNG